jgi:hypothetical protein
MAAAIDSEQAMKYLPGSKQLLEDALHEIPWHGVSEGHWKTIDEPTSIEIVLGLIRPTCDDGYQAGVRGLARPHSRLKLSVRFKDAGEAVICGWADVTDVATIAMRQGTVQACLVPKSDDQRSAVVRFTTSQGKQLNIVVIMEQGGELSLVEI